MSKFIVRWDAGYGANYEEVSAKNEEDALKQAYELWKEDVENNADYEVVGKSTDELREEYL
jgi:hypothetical protein